MTDPENSDVELSGYERDLMEAAGGKVLLLQLTGTMIFGVSRAITRKNSGNEACRALIIDISKVDHLGVSSALALEEAMLDMLRAGRRVYVVGAYGQPRDRLERLGILQQLPAENITTNRTVAMERAIYGSNDIVVSDRESEPLIGNAH